MDVRVVANIPDLSNYWMPFTANRQFKAAHRLLVSAHGMYYTTIEGQKIIDGTAGLWCVNAGHGRENDREEQLRVSSSRWILPHHSKWAIRSRLNLPESLPR